ncbi:4Fe-4S binding protein [Clostridium ganghwense]|uniref:4Fe-4S binding protein n=1 Tax=Clostridium ganghwense TaxID=312089 RepID=A0ABT4CKA1_9CLOT|nr:4Fe-4S dicluster domain-containing protein [Clostridium ganghwense]MCY6369485.1 4Fe-4S binding protein [Clostridium ganghwense]
MKNSNERWNISNESLKKPLVFLILFLSIGIWRWKASGNTFYLFNFGYIGLSISIGMFLNGALPKKHKSWGRRITQLLVGCYMLIFLGIINRENMQLEGFFIYFMLGIFEAATLHYFVAKIVGPLIFGRGWCGYACWTAMVLDLLPYKIPKEGRVKKFGVIRYIHFFLSLIVVLIIWSTFGSQNFGKHHMIELYMLLGGNIIYYVVGISLAYVLKDNRAFCKYVCPIPVIQKLTSPFSVMKIEIDANKCVDCGVCEKVCPMNVKLLTYKNEGKRILSSECINCQTCANVCPKSAIKSTFKFDVSFTEQLNYKDK